MRNNGLSWESARHDTLVQDNRDLPLESCSCTQVTKRKTHPTHKGEGALILSKSAQSALIGWEALGSCIVTTSFRTTKKRIAMNIIQCYAPTNGSDDQIKVTVSNWLF